MPPPKASKFIDGLVPSFFKNKISCKFWRKIYFVKRPLDNSFKYRYFFMNTLNRQKHIHANKQITIFPLISAFITNYESLKIAEII